MTVGREDVVILAGELVHPPEQPANPHRLRQSIELPTVLCPLDEVVESPVPYGLPFAFVELVPVEVIRFCQAVLSELRFRPLDVIPAIRLQESVILCSFVPLIAPIEEDALQEAVP